MFGRPKIAKKPICVTDAKEFRIMHANITFLRKKIVGPHVDIVIMSPIINPTNMWR